MQCFKGIVRRMFGAALYCCLSESKCSLGVVIFWICRALGPGNKAAKRLNPEGGTKYLLAPSWLLLRNFLDMFLLLFSCRLRGSSYARFAYLGELSGFRACCVCSLFEFSHFSVEGGTFDFDRPYRVLARLRRFGTSRRGSKTRKTASGQALSFLV